jgi:voltage-gated potassium channel
MANPDPTKDERNSPRSRSRSRSRSAIQAIIDNDGSTVGRIFTIVIQALIVLSLVAFSIDTLPDLSARLRRALRIFEIISIIVFTAEYLARLYVADRKIRFFFSFYGLVDLAAILPFYLSTGIDLRSLRVFRLFRLVRVFKLFRYSKAIVRFKTAFLMVREELVIFFGATLFLLFVSAVGIYYFENPAQPEVFSSVFHSLWWAVATLTTVGYGDIYPVTAGGKTFTFIILMIGLGTVAVPTGLISSSLTKTIANEKESVAADDKNIHDAT